MVWISDGSTVRTYDGRSRTATTRPARPRAVGIEDPHLPPFGRAYRPLTQLPADGLVDTFVHPHGFCRNVLATADLTLRGTARLVGREVYVLRADHPRSTEVLTDRPDRWLEVAVDRLSGLLLLLAEHVGDQLTRHAEVTSLELDAPISDDVFVLHVSSDVALDLLTPEGRTSGAGAQRLPQPGRHYHPRTVPVAGTHPAGEADEGGYLMTQARSREDTIQQDIKDLHRLGYAQELFRSMGGFSNFAISFSIISILTGAVILYDYGLAWAGTAAVMIGWPLVTVFVLLIAASMAEIASAYPTAGGLYYWASKMKNKAWGWWTAWFNLHRPVRHRGRHRLRGAPVFLNATIVDAALRDDVQHGQRVFGQAWLTGQLVDDGRDHADPAGHEHRRHPPRRAAQPGQRVVAHRHRGRGGGADLPHRQARPVRACTLFQIQPLDTVGSWNNNLGFVNLQYGAGDHVPADPRLLLLAAAGQLDLHRLRRLRPRGGRDRRRPRRRAPGASSSRSPCRPSSGTSSWSP